MSTRSGQGPLAGVRVVVTRPAHQAGRLAAAFAAAGARVALLPLLDVVPPADPGPLEEAARDVGRFDWVVLTSANAAHALFPRLPRLPLMAAGGRPPGRPRLPRMAAVGPATAEAIRSYGAEVDLVAERRDAEGLAAELAPRVAGKAVLLPLAADARPELARGLAAAGARLSAVVAYDKGLPPAAREAAARLFAEEPLGWVTFTSPRIVEHFVELLGESWEERRGELRAASIGPVTSRALERRGVHPAAEAETPGDEELVRAVAAAMGA